MRMSRPAIARKAMARAATRSCPARFAPCAASPAGMTEPGTESEVCCVNYQFVEIGEADRHGRNLSLYPGKRIVHRFRLAAQLIGDFAIGLSDLVSRQHA